MTSYNKKQICKANILEVLDTERERTGEGIFQEKLVSLFYEGHIFDENLFGLIQKLEKQKLISIKNPPKSLQKLISITNKGRRELELFLGNADEKSRELFFKQRPFTTELMTRLRLVEIFFGSLCTLMIIGLIWFFLIFFETKGRIQIPLELSILIGIITGIPFSIAFFFFLVSFASISVLGIGSVIGYLGFNIGFVIVENLEKIVRILTYLLLIGGSIVAIYFLGLKGLIGAFLLNGIIFLFKNRIRLFEWAKNFKKK